MRHVLGLFDAAQRPSDKRCATAEHGRRAGWADETLPQAEYVLHVKQARFPVGEKAGCA
jgi:hypothetical protein